MNFSFQQQVEQESLQVCVDQICSLVFSYGIYVLCFNVQGSFRQKLERVGQLRLFQEEIRGSGTS